MPVATITIFEDYHNSVPDVLNSKQDLMAFRDIVGYKNFNLQIDGTFSVAHYIGFFAKGKTRLQILPKIYSKTSIKSGTQDEINDSVKFVFKLLAEAGYFKNLKLNPQIIGAANGDLLEIFITLFADEFNSLISRKIFRQYIPVEENQQFIKGKILYAETIKNNHGLNHKHYIRYDEYSSNNLLNQIFKSVAFHLLQITKSSATKTKLATALAHLADIDLISLHIEKFKQIRFDRLNSDFQPLFDMAKLFFNNLQPGLTGGNERTFTFLIPLHDLYENYIAKALKEMSFQDYKFQHHKPCSYLATLNNQNAFLLKPDFTLVKGEEVLMILDAKYKYPFNDKGAVQLNTDDLYQLCTYALHYQCNDLYLIYPVFKDTAITQNKLATYTIPSAFGNIELKIIQVEIIESTFDQVKVQLTNSLGIANEVSRFLFQL